MTTATAKTTPSLLPTSIVQTSQEEVQPFNSPFAKMFPSGATPEELKQFLNTFLKMMIVEFQHADKAWQRGQQKMRKAARGEDDS